MKEPVNYKENCFDLLRYYAAFAVMLLHYSGYSMILSAKGHVVLSPLRKMVLFYPGVIVLFAISGFLISASFERTDSRKVFFQKRIFRLFPELWLCTIFNLVVLSFLAFKLFDQSILTWILTQIFGIANTPSCLKDFATGSVNGALWTIFVELQLYVVTMLFYPYLKKLSLKSWSLLLLLAAGTNLVLGFLAPNSPSLVQKLIERSFLPYGLWFLAGMFCYCQRNLLLPILKKLCPLLIIIYFILYQLPLKEYGYYCEILTSILCPFITIGLAFWLPSFRIKRDLSYGIFLYHWIVLNVFVHFDLMNRLAWPIAVLLFIGVTLVLAWCSQIFTNFLRKELLLCDTSH